jgi:hypothetical protein
MEGKRMINITRIRYIIVRDGTEIFCGISKNYSFRPVGKIGDAAVKTYRSEAQAIAALNRSWFEDYDGERYQVHKVVESVMEVME